MYILSKTKIQMKMMMRNSVVSPARAGSVAESRLHNLPVQPDGQMHVKFWSYGLVIHVAPVKHGTSLMQYSMDRQL